MAGSLFLITDKTNPKFFITSITKLDQNAVFHFDRGELEITDTGLSLYCQLIKSPINCLAKNKEEKWAELDKNDAPYLLLLNMPFVGGKEKIKLPNHEALLKYIKEELGATENKIYLSGELNIEETPVIISDYLNGEDVDRHKLKNRYFDLKVIEKDMFDLPPIDKKAIASSSGNRGGASNQKVSERIEERLNFFKSLAEPEVKAKIVEAHLNILSTAKEIDPKASISLIELLAIITK